MSDVRPPLATLLVVVHLFPSECLFKRWFITFTFCSLPIFPKLLQLSISIIECTHVQRYPCSDGYLVISYITVILFEHLSPTTSTSNDHLLPNTTTDMNWCLDSPPKFCRTSISCLIKTQVLSSEFRGCLSDSCNKSKLIQCSHG